MDDAILFLLPLAGGYALSTIWTASLYHASRESGHRLYLRAIFYAAILIIICSLLHVIFFATFQTYRVDVLGFIAKTFHFNEKIELFNEPSRYLITCTSVILGPIIGHAFNITRLSFLLDPEGKNLLSWVVRFLQNWELIQLRHAIQNNDFEKLLIDAFFKDMPILFSLDNGKVYVGWVVAAPNPIHTRRAVRILPLLSGYRDSETHQVKFLTDYFEIFELISSGKTEELNHLSADDFEVVLPVDCIISSHLFDLMVYEFFQTQEQQLILDSQPS
ncbi:MAG: hypothetical protein KZQ80_17030 [Candidatus Thiodiazotropha sp. (ex Monitilora ramsayi)]|nr:hypothetical protein [Candidatus Thiodiazotropha sp. (ex Monitilora ramsayi)]